jgi:hypothetical protein
MSAAQLPLAAAAIRLRGRPGRPPKELDAEERAKRRAEKKARRAEKEALREARLAAIQPRLADVEGAAHYLGGISPWTVRDLIASGQLPRVRLPLGRDRSGRERELRRMLVDLRDCDKLIEQSKEGGAERPAS